MITQAAKYVSPETFPNIASILDYWDTYISENERMCGSRWGKGWQGNQRKRFSWVKNIAILFKSRGIELEHDNLLPPMERLLPHKKSITVLCDRLTLLSR